MMKTYNDKNEEILDTKPIAVPLDMKIPESVDAMMNRLINSKFADIELSQAYETFEEADDFECDDDSPDYTSPWEEVYDPRTGESLGFLEQNRYQPKEYFYDNDDFAFNRNMATGETSREVDRADEIDSSKA